MARKKKESTLTPERAAELTREVNEAQAETFVRAGALPLEAAPEEIKKAAAVAEPPPAPPPLPVEPPRPRFLAIDVAVFRRMAGALVHAVFKDDDSPIRSCLHVVQRDDRLTLEATDGAWLARWVVEHPVDGELEFIIPGDRLGAFLKLLPKTDEQLLLFDAQRVTIGPDALHGPGCRIDFVQPEGLFPPVEACIPRRERWRGMPWVEIAPGYLLAASKVLEAAGAKGVCISIGPGPIDIVLLSGSNTKGLVVGVMPRVQPAESAEAAE